MHSTTRYLGILVVASVAAGCSSSSDDTSSSQDALSAMQLNGAYTASDATGTVREIIFQGTSEYVLYREPCADGNPCIEEGTYALDAAHTSLSLTDSTTGQTTTFPFHPDQVASPTTTQSVKPQGLISDGGTLIYSPDAGAPISLVLYNAGVALVKAFTMSEEGDVSSSFQSNDGSPLGADPSGSPAKYPFVLASGIITSPTKNNFLNVPAAFMADGHQVYVADLPPLDSTEVRAPALAQAIDAALAQFGATKVNIIAHSSGGTDARYAISTLGYGDRVASLTTISSAHHGTPVADAALQLLPYPGLDPVLDGLASLFGRTFSDVASDSHIRAMLTSISTANAVTFNANNQDDARVYYQSWAGVADIGGFAGPNDDATCEGMHFGGNSESGIVHPFMAPMAAVITTETPGAANDSMVPTASAKWGTFRGCVPADHLSEIGDPSQASAVDANTDFDHVRFYRTVAFDLAAKGY